MAVTDWTINSSGGAATTELHASLSGPLSDHGDRLYSQEGSGEVGARSIRTEHRDLDALQSTEVMAWLRADRTAYINIAARVFLSGADANPTGGTSGAIKGICAGLFAESDPGTGTVVKMIISDPDGGWADQIVAGTGGAAAVTSGTWVRVRLRRQVVSGTQLRYRVAVASMAAPDTFVDVVDQTYNSSDPGYVDGVQPVMGWAIASSFGGGFARIDGWQGGAYTP